MVLVLTLFNPWSWWIVFLVTLTISAFVSNFIKEPEGNLQLKIQNIGAQLDSLTKEVSEIKKAIED